MTPSIVGSNQGSGSQNIAAGSGVQNNNNSSGVQFNNSIFREAVVENPQLIEAKTIREEKDACLRSLAFQRMDERCETIDNAYPRTCDWIFQTEFQKWWNRSEICTHNGVLWIKGHPGVGKSTLVKHIRNWCEKTTTLGTYSIIHYFFSARGTIHERSTLGMLRSILFQLVSKDEVIFDKFLPIFRKHNAEEQKDFAWTASLLKSVILSAAQEKNIKPIVLFIDALDECSGGGIKEAIGFLEDLSCIAACSSFELRICLSSRHYPSINMKKRIQLIMENQKEHHNDISIYIEEKLHFQDEAIISKLQQKASGIFMWVAIVISQLNQMYDEGYIEEIEKALEVVPEGLEKVFKGLLEENGKVNPETLLILQWVLFALTPLTPEELFYATRVARGPEHHGIEFTKDDIKRRINTTSKGLIEVRSRRSFEGDDEYVRFIHQSVNDFLFRNQRLSLLEPNLSPDPITLSHRRLWDICWSSLSEFCTCYSEIKNNLDDAESSKVGTRFPLVRYAKTYIFKHADLGILQEQETSGWRKWKRYVSRNEGIFQWLREHTVWYQWWQKAPSYSHHREFGQLSAFDGSEGIVYTLSVTGCSRLLQLILNSEGIDPNEEGGRYGNALQAVAVAGLEQYEAEEIIRLLVDAGADINLQDVGYYGNALLAAVATDSFEMAKLLLKAGANVNAQCGYFGTALQRASASVWHDTNLVRLLLEAGADINPQSGHYGSALQAACHRENEGVVKLLLEAGADVNTKGGEYGNSLQAACASYFNSPDTNQEVVRLLLGNGADVNSQGGRFGSALQAASYYGQKETVQILLRAGARASVNGQGGQYGNPLQAASASGNKEIVKLLLEAGSYVNSQGGEYGTALQAASVTGNTGIVRLLVEAGAVNMVADST